MSLDSAIAGTGQEHFHLGRIGEIIDLILDNPENKQAARVDVCARFNVPTPPKEAGVKSRKDLACYIHDTLYPHCCDCYFDQF